MPNKYTYQEAINKSLEYFKGDELAASVIVGKYYLNDNDVYVESIPDEMFRRIAKEFARIEKKYKNPISEDEIFELMSSWTAFPQGSGLFGIGNNSQYSSIANCFVVKSPDDSYSSILKADQELVQLCKRRGGVGASLSNLRPEGSEVNNAAKTSTGIMPFMERFSNSIKEVAQCGRRGALLLSINVKHPEILRFINIKKDRNKITGANISVQFTDDFMSYVVDNKDRDFSLQFPIDVPLEKAKIVRKIKAKDVWNNFIENTWDSAEPGCLFIDTVKNNSLSDCYKDEGFETLTTNPCGELPLSAYGECTLFVINLTKFIEKPFTKNAEFNKEKFVKTLRKSMRLIDDMVDLEEEKIDKILDKISKDPEDEFTKSIEKNLWENVKNILIKGRRVGLGFTAFGDMLAYLNIRYDSNEALKITKEIASLYHETLMDEQAELAKDRGAFPIFNWKKEKDCCYNTVLSEETQEKIKKNGRRNISITTCAPAGSISLLTQTTSGIEPVFKLQYKRRKKITEEELKSNKNAQFTVDNDGIKWIEFIVEHHGLKLWKEVTGETDITKSPYYNCEAGNINWSQRVKLQSIWQKYLTASISNTYNLPTTTTKEEVSQIYIEAWKYGCKGLTIYREGSRDGVLVSNDNKSNSVNITYHNVQKRPKALICDIHYSNVLSKKNPEKIEHYIFFVGLDSESKPYEIFGGRNEKIVLPKKYKSGFIVKNGKNEQGLSTYDLVLGAENPLIENDDGFIIKDIISEFKPEYGTICRMVSMSLRHGVPVHIIGEQLLKDTNNENMFCFEKCVARILKKYIKDGIRAAEVCSDCGSKMVYKDGCAQCMNCGKSKCS